MALHRASLYHTSFHQHFLDQNRRIHHVHLLVNLNHDKFIKYKLYIGLLYNQSVDQLGYVEDYGSVIVENTDLK